MICQGPDISKYFKASLGIRDNESRLYLVFVALADLCHRLADIRSCRKKMLSPGSNGILLINPYLKMFSDLKRRGPCVLIENKTHSLLFNS